MTAPLPQPSPVEGDPERRALRGSLWLTVFTATLALVVGILTGTRIIVFDGAYLAIGLVLTFISLRAAAASAAGPSRRFPFGQDALTPLVVIVQGLAILGTLVFAAADAVVLIRQGGSSVAPLVIATYGVATVVIGLVFQRWLRGRAQDSDLVQAELAQWRAGTVLSAMMVVGAAAAAGADRAGWRSVSLFIDPVLVLIASVSLGFIPIRMLMRGANELLEGAPEPRLLAAVVAAVESVRADYGLAAPTVRSGKVGRKLYVEVDFLVRGDVWDVAHEDDVRRAVRSALEPLGFDVWAYVSLTADPELAA